ncbi:DUF983 domain-containing protein [Aurantimonas sp. MSK8Z-1]|uniref:DUF983 domain-containing protein n=1 Tax=Mangrovibrevibacter kandeliae TaxID=2968473 RepID=UPI002117AAA7|nr:DUF983 domain-containing protein [Aurantimonas sp. MSK8Z-1]MCW4114687.1 DUF983 domain-containing protein [Aurantimonas sp. MSK8Z-1]
MTSDDLAGPAEGTTGVVRSIPQAVKRGFLMRCPKCGEGRLFRAYLKSVDHCAVCGEAFHHQRADDLPPYLVIFIVGHLVVALFMGLEEMVDWPLWAHLALFVPLTLVLALGLLQPMKGATIGLQWAMRMHGFGHDGGAGDGR